VICLWSNLPLFFSPTNIEILGNFAILGARIGFFAPCFHYFSKVHLRLCYVMMHSDNH